MNKYIKEFSLGLVALLMASCTQDIDNWFSRNNSDVQFSDIPDYIKLDEDHPDDVALGFQWTSAHDYGNDYITTYKYVFTVDGSSAQDVVEYEDDAKFERQYTNKDLQDLLVNHFGVLTSSNCKVLLTLTASFEGPQVKVPDVTTASFEVKTYGPKQFLADSLYIDGTAVADGRTQLQKSSSDDLVYSATVHLVAGKVNFPLTYGDEQNAIGPLTSDAALNKDEMEAQVTDESKANSWVITEDDNYRVNVNLRTHTVKIQSAGAIVEADQIFLSGTATGGTQIEVSKTLEDDNLYAWRGELKKGELYMPLTFNESQEMALVPSSTGSHDICDGTLGQFAVAKTNQTSKRYWSIPSDGTYRIVFNVDEKTITFYSEATDMQNMSVSYNNTTIGKNPYTQEIVKLWMWGSYNSFAHDSGIAENCDGAEKNIADGFQDKYTLTQSLANPYIFVYKGAILPRETAAIGKDSPKGAVKFCISNHNNNVYAFGSTADAKRNDHNGFITVTDNSPLGLVAGQSDNRYAFFLLPENCNYIIVDIKNLTVRFMTK